MVVKIYCVMSAKKKNRRRKYPKIYNYKQKFYFCPENQFKKYWLLTEQTRPMLNHDDDITTYLLHFFFSETIHRNSEFIYKRAHQPPFLSLSRNSINRMWIKGTKTFWKEKISWIDWQSEWRWKKEKKLYVFK